VAWRSACDQATLPRRARSHPDIDFHPRPLKLAFKTGITLATRKKSINFEDSLAQLETLVSELESGDLSLEDSLKAFEKGIRITRECNDALKEASQRVELLTRTPQGELEATPFDAPETE